MISKKNTSIGPPTAQDQNLIISSKFTSRTVSKCLCSLTVGNVHHKRYLSNPPTASVKVKTNQSNTASFVFPKASVMRKIRYQYYT